VAETPRISVAALSGGAGKTIVSLGLARHWRKQGLTVKPYKKGPDYIDAVWLGRASGSRATNLDPFFLDRDQLTHLFLTQYRSADIGLIEGNRGLFDGKDTDGSCSTAHLARCLGSPVLLILNCTKMTRTAAAIVQGCSHFEEGLHIAGVVLNRTAGQRHRRILRQCIETYTDVPVLGALPKMEKAFIPERHMGLISDREFAAEEAIDECARIIGEWIDTEAVLTAAGSAPRLEAQGSDPWQGIEAVGASEDIRIGVVRDASLWFYYPENIEALERAGARIVEVSLLAGETWPEVHGLYLGGGFPETQAEELAGNVAVRRFISGLAERGLPIYAECGGLMYLCQTLVTQGSEQVFPMAGVFPLRSRLCQKPQGHGYTLTQVQEANPFHPVGLEFTGHEFHYSSCDILSGNNVTTCLRMLRGTGLGDLRDGLIYKNTFACYTHLHALSVPGWAGNFVRAARAFKRAMASGQEECPLLRAG
jgi:cobyrinic acid a,c-diamide synthase